MPCARDRAGWRVLSVLLVLVGLAAVPACQLDVHCPDVVPASWWGSVDSAGVEYVGYGGKTVEATIFRPADTSAFPGPRPVLVVDHGYDEDECHEWWSAWALAGHGYIVLAPTSVPQPEQVPDTEAAVEWLLSPENPILQAIDPDRLGLVGYSAGAEAAQVVEATDLRVKGVVALDNLRLMSYGCPDDPGSPNAAGAVVLTPRVPALGIGRDGDCDEVPASGSTDYNMPGFENHLAAGVPTADFTLAGSHHLDFETGGPDPIQHEAFTIMLAWLDTWVAGDPTALGRITAATWSGLPRSAFLSTYYRSAIAVPGYVCLDLSQPCADSLQTAPSVAALASGALLVEPTAPAPASLPLDQPHPLGPPGSTYPEGRDEAGGRSSG